MENLTTNKFVLKALDALTGQIVYFGESKRFLRFDAAKAGLHEVPANTDKIRVALIGKQHYTELKKEYPIQNKRELKQILQLEYPTDEHAMSFFTIGDFSEGMRSVTIWKMKFDVNEALGMTSGLVIPEGALINQAIPEKSILTLKFDEEKIEHWFYRDQNSLPHSGAKRGLIQSAERFLASVGIAETVESKQYAWSDYVDFLQEKLPLFLLQASSSFFYTHSSAIPDYASFVKPFSLIATVVLGGYLSLSSAYLVLRNSSAEEEAIRLSQEAKSVFQLREQAKSQLAQLDELAMLSEGISASSLIWKEIGSLMKQGVEFQSISFLPDGRYIIRGNADSATSVLSVFSGNDVYQGAKFYSATQRRKERDYFSITTQLASQSMESGNE